LAGLPLGKVMSMVKDAVLSNSLYIDLVIVVGCVINMDRVKVLGGLLSELSFEGIVHFDLKEPEYEALNTLFNEGVSP